MLGGMFRSSRIKGGRENRLFVPKMLNHIANEVIDDRIHLSQRTAGEYHLSQIVRVVGEALMLRIDYAVAGKKVTVGTMPADFLDDTHILG